MTNPRIIRVFPRRNEATPTDALAFVGWPPFPSMIPEFDAVHVSVTFSEDMPLAERLRKAWASATGRAVALGGPATGMRGEEFVPGRYLREGYVITSRGCPNSCWFCAAWKREGRGVRELPIRDGWNLVDDNLLACSEAHVRAVFAMLKRNNRAVRATPTQEALPGRRVKFSGGLEAARLKAWHVELLADLKPSEVFFAYDEPRDWEPLKAAARLMAEAWPGSITGHRLHAYVLVGGPRDTIALAEQRLAETWALGVLPFAMVWDGRDRRETAWAALQRTWNRVEIAAARAMRLQRLTA